LIAASSDSSAVARAHSLPASGLRAIRPRASVALEAVDQIKEMIIQGDLRAGQKLPTERELAETLGVSRPTVRESIRALAALRIVEPMHGAGTYVTSLKPELLAQPIDFLLQVNDDALLDLFDTRMVLESGLARLAGSRRTKADIAVLEKTIALHAASVDDATAALELDFRFHAEVAAAAHSPIMASLLASTAVLGRASRARTGQTRQVRITAHEDHESIVRALHKRDPEAAEQAMIAHLEHIRQAIQ